jgi:hypothetical protein
MVLVSGVVCVIGAWIWLLRGCRAVLQAWLAE